MSIILKGMYELIIMKVDYGPMIMKVEFCYVPNQKWCKRYWTFVSNSIQHI